MAQEVPASHNCIKEKRLGADNRPGLEPDPAPRTSTCARLMPAPRPRPCRGVDIFGHQNRVVRLLARRDRYRSSPSRVRSLAGTALTTPDVLHIPQRRNNGAAYRSEQIADRSYPRPPSFWEPSIARRLIMQKRRSAHLKPRDQNSVDRGNALQTTYGKKEELGLIGPVLSPAQNLRSRRAEFPFWIRSSQGLATPAYERTPRPGKSTTHGVVAGKLFAACSLAIWPAEPA